LLKRRARPLRRYLPLSLSMVDLASVELKLMPLSSMMIRAFTPVFMLRVAQPMLTQSEQALVLCM